MTLYEGRLNEFYIVTGVYVEEVITRRLQALGINEGTMIFIQNRNHRGAIIIRVRGTRLALGKHIASYIEVNEVKQNDIENPGFKRRRRRLGR